MNLTPWWIRSSEFGSRNCALDFGPVDLAIDQITKRMFSPTNRFHGIVATLAYASVVFLSMSDFSIDILPQAFAKRSRGSFVWATDLPVNGLALYSTQKQMRVGDEAAYNARSKISPNSSAVKTIGLAFMLDAAAAFCARAGKSARVTP